MDENQGLKRQQAKDRCWKLWERSPLNPKNQSDPKRIQKKPEEEYKE